jgi:hypothetical protein
VIDQLAGQLVEVVSELDLTAKGAKRLGYGTTALHRYETRDRAAGALNDHLLASFDQLHEPRQLTLGLVHADLDHTNSVPGLARTG